MGGLSRALSQAWGSFTEPAGDHQPQVPIGRSAPAARRARGNGGVYPRYRAGQGPLAGRSTGVEAPDTRDGTTRC
jgi:hypothetical protein